jgi:hypothetical protein
MKRESLPGRIAAVLTIMLLVALSVQGLVNVMSNLADTVSAWQWMMTGAQATYSVLGLFTALALWLSPPMAFRLAIVWGAALIVALAAIPPAWVPEDVAGWWRYAAAGALIAALGIAGTALGARR